MNQKSMPTVTVLEKRKIRLLVEYQKYVVRFLGFDTVEEGIYGPTVHYKYEILNGEDENGQSTKGFEHNQMFGAECRVGSPYYKHICGLIGKSELEEGLELDLNTYKGKLYEAVFNHKEKKSDPSKIFNNITKISRYVKPNSTGS